MRATCINIDITWSDARLTICVNTVLFKQLPDTHLTEEDWRHTIVHDDVLKRLRLDNKHKNLGPENTKKTMQEHLYI